MTRRAVTSIFCGSFVAAWLIFLVARLNAKINPEPSLSVASEKSIDGATGLVDPCLGSRFSAWGRVA